MIITTKRVKQYNSTTKTIVFVDAVPVCIVSGNGKTVSNIMAYLNGYDVPIADGKIKKILDKLKEENNEQLRMHFTNKKSFCTGHGQN